MAQHRRDKTERLAAGAPPKVKIRLGDDGVQITPDQAADGVHPETVAEERPPQAEDTRTNLVRNVGGPYGI